MNLHCTYPSCVEGAAIQGSVDVIPNEPGKEGSSDRRNDDEDRQTYQKDSPATAFATLALRWSLLACRQIGTAGRWFIPAHTVTCHPLLPPSIWGQDLRFEGFSSWELAAPGPAAIPATLQPADGTDFPGQKDP